MNTLFMLAISLLFLAIWFLYPNLDNECQIIGHLPDRTGHCRRCRRPVKEGCNNP